MASRTSQVPYEKEINHIHINVDAVKGGIFLEEALNDIPLRTLGPILVTNAWHM